MRRRRSWSRAQTGQTSTTKPLSNTHEKVTVTGSIFYDTHHPAGEIGAAEFKPQTAWEIHPVSEIVFAR